MPTPLSPSAHRRTNLTPWPSSFVGRGALMESVEWSLGRGQIVALVGPPGVGKTRLAREVVLDRAEHLEGGAWFCDLSSCVDAQDMCTVLSSVLRIGLPDRRPAERLGRALAVRGEVLLVLDQIEDLAEGSAETVELWASLAPDARFVLTSRVPPRMNGELVVAVERLGSAAGVVLYGDRLRRGLEDGERAGVRKLVEDLDGVPLAIEVAAALGLTSLPPGVGSLEWAWEYLDGPEQLALAQLTVFEGCFDFEAAENVVQVSGVSSAGLAQSLRAKSLVVEVPALPEPQLSLMRGVRELAASRLQNGDVAGLRHARLVLERAEALRISSEERPEALDRLGALMGDLAAIRRRYRGHPVHGVLAARAALAQAPAWTVRGPMTTIERVMDEVLSDALGNPRLELGIRVAHAEAVAVQGRLDGAYGLLLAILDEARAVADELASGRTLRLLAMIRSMQGDPQEARRLAAQAQAEFQWAGEARDAAHMRCEQGQHALRAGDLDEALELLDAGVKALRRGDWPRSLAGRLPQLAMVHLERGELKEGLATATEALDIAVELGDAWIESRALRAAADARTRLGHSEEARTLLERAAGRISHYGAAPTEILVLGQIVELDEAAGALEAAEEGWRRLIRRCHELEYRRQAAVFSGRLGGVLGRQGRVDEARDVLLGAAAALEEMGLVQRSTRLRDHASALLLGG